MKIGLFTRNFLIFTLLLVVCAASLAIYTIRAGNKIDRADDLVIHTQNALIAGQELKTLAQTLSTNARGYAITEDARFLERYIQARNAISQHIEELRVLVQDNSAQQNRLIELQRYMVEFARILERNQPSARGGLSEAGMIDLENNIISTTDQILEDERTLFHARSAALEDATDRFQFTLLMGGGLAAALLALLNSFLLQEQARRQGVEKSLIEAQERLRLAIQGANDGIFDWDLVSDSLYWSPQYMEMLGYREGEIESSIGLFRELVHPEDRDLLWKTYDEYIEGERSEFNHTFRMQHKSGRWIWMNARGKAVRNRSGKAIRFLGAHSDITDIKEYETQLEIAKERAEKASAAKGEFLAHMSHEIRTPLTAISGIAEILDQSIDSVDDKFKKLIRTLHSSTSSLKDLVTDILDFSKIESGEVELENKYFFLIDLFQQVVSIVSVRAAEKHLDFSFDYRAVKDLSFYGDKARLRQILLNLIGNAVKFTDSGFIRIRAYMEEDMLHVEVADSGIGMNEKAIQVIFERFRQADSSVSRKYGGTGLGLPISKNLAELMGGKITVKSAPGTGSVFTLILPVRKSDTEEASGKGEETNVRERGRENIIDGKKRVLLAEDYEGNVVVLSHILENLGCGFDVAETGLEAIQMWKQNHYDLILMDVQMPEMDGLTATRTIRTMEDEQSIEETPIIGLTAHALVADKEKCIESGMNDYLSKPIVEADLKATILKYIEKKQPGKDSQAA